MFVHINSDNYWLNLNLVEIFLVSGNSYICKKQHFHIVRDLRGKIIEYQIGLDGIDFGAVIANQHTDNVRIMPEHVKYIKTYDE